MLSCGMNSRRHGKKWCFSLYKRKVIASNIQYNLDAPLVNNSRHKFNMSDKVQILMYADDVVLLSNDRSVLNSLIQSLSEEFTRYGSKINTQKSKIMAVWPEADNTDTHLGRYIKLTVVLRKLSSINIWAVYFETTVP